MKSFSKSAALFAATAVAFSPFAAPVSGAQERVTMDFFSKPTPVTVKQGYEFYTVSRSGGAGKCTIAYNDASHRQSLTAAHCGSEGGTVYMRDNRGYAVPAGTFHPSRAYDSGSSANDWAVIKWNSNATLAPNTFSGDRIIPLNELRKGDKICLRGHTSHGATSTGYSCSTYAGNLSNVFFFDNIAGQQGDSGGAVFVPGRGFVGVYSGMNQVGGKDGNWKRLERASVPADGRNVPRDEQGMFAALHFGLGSFSEFRINGIPIPVSDGSSKWLGEKPSSSEGKDIRLTNGAILGIVLSILLTVVPMIASFFR